MPILQSFGSIAVDVLVLAIIERRTEALKNSWNCKRGDHAVVLIVGPGGLVGRNLKVKTTRKLFSQKLDDKHCKTLIRS